MGKIIYTLTDEAPRLATEAFLPVLRTFAAPAGIGVETSDISVAARILAALPERLTEEQQARRSPTGGTGKDSAEVENYVRGFARRRPDVSVCTLRMANVVGRGFRTQLSDYLSMPVMPVPGTKVTSAVVSSEVGGAPAPARPLENAMLKQAACAAPRISSGLVPLRSSPKFATQTAPKSRAGGSPPRRRSQ